jgi:hypothetical protein
VKPVFIDLESVNPVDTNPDLVNTVFVHPDSVNPVDTKPDLVNRFS